MEREYRGRVQVRTGVSRRVSRGRASREGVRGGCQGRDSREGFTGGIHGRDSREGVRGGCQGRDSREGVRGGWSESFRSHHSPQTFFRAASHPLAASYPQRRQLQLGTSSQLVPCTLQPVACRKLLPFRRWAVQVQLQQQGHLPPQASVAGQVRGLFGPSWNAECPRAPVPGVVASSRSLATP